MFHHPTPVDAAGWPVVMDESVEIICWCGTPDCPELADLH